MRHTLQAIAIVAVSLFTTTAFAQLSERRVEPVAFPYAPPEAPHFNSSTVAEGFLRGHAVRIQAEGNFRLLEAQADILRRQSESMGYDNYLKKTATALARKQMLSDYRDFQREQKLARREASRDLQYQRDLDLASDYRLNKYQFNWETGAIYWPSFVAGPRYAAHRHDLERLMHHMVHYGSFSNELLRAEAVRLAEDFRDHLREDFRTLADRNFRSVQNEYLDTHRFLLGLKFAPLLQDAAVGQTLAMND